MPLSLDKESGIKKLARRLRVRENRAPRLKSMGPDSPAAHPH
jgi:hypothetical protein